MSDNFLFKAVKGAAKLGASYMSSTADRLSRNSSYSDEQREQFRDMHSAFSDMKDRLSGDTSSYDYDGDDDYDYDYDDDYNYGNTSYSYEEENNSTATKTPLKNSVYRYFSQMTFAGYQWYIIHRNSQNNTVLLLSKDILEVMPFSISKKTKYETSVIYKWLNNEFQSQLKSKLKDRDKERLIKIFLLSSKETDIYIPSSKARRAEKNGSSDWWLGDGKGEFIKIIKDDGTIGKAIPTELHGVRPTILVRLKEKSR